MKELVTLEVASRLFTEAHGFTSGRISFIEPDSEIRTIAKAVFHSEMSVYLNHVCYEIYYVLACEFMDVPRD